MAVFVLSRSGPLCFFTFGYFFLAAVDATVLSQPEKFIPSLKFGWFEETPILHFSTRKRPSKESNRKQSREGASSSLLRLCHQSRTSIHDWWQLIKMTYIVAITRYIAYYRVSTQKQGCSDLGFDDQRQMVQRFLPEGEELVQAFTEIESGP